ncbi:MAG: symmetrical bis(5'-nucleosyl)-tetraphosphatase [Methylicorpusculum sp.]|uniref:symmetrical bis(5'-nucleosyl)-tetraphosphatase n=1 Tax=Methylicorpusculum sp. TaxID=2713644 RepID=UPI002726D8A7|nr:symmetrical bis(5'-nucleosyl)-tetraphosphatase [Methylicorpusculum sp.]MDO8845714.1 symmetrical bis(5'-nucleosyl)-tetraphosphatase [Methylicorpusculum sp.]MDO8940438.1 symmetrical bis(5'-nucleosyl)-tetraphosphatase [Methylicorpusculum sp.]MDP2177323.1 symmetrical bis(5'-nucleosyl)-tetraphosphatase [Methylicorpusculum sp.]MDP3531030.1 symmetrical bis(5'-nucleosyl)-tetraphosphatase [Methylicorpusculum sp.]MDZ4153784.1 symmetrical bis(5'-nucleosyl)-tetraphosphatase [Methylicorpusculum sp.]
MSIYAIGDIQGCYDDLMRLLDAVKFNENDDQLWFAGDLVNRGPKSLETLRFVKSLGDSAITVLGNHDLHLLAMAHSVRTERKKDSLSQILESPDRDELLDWLRHRPLFHFNEQFCLVHAGLPPQWDFDTVCDMARLVESALRHDDYPELLQQMYGNKPNSWTSQLKGNDRLRFIINCMTRMRYCDDNGRLDFEHNGPPGTQPKSLKPWFAVPNRKSAGLTIIFGHWSSLGYSLQNNCYCIDSGCLWGGELTALHLGDPVYRVSVHCQGSLKPNAKIA